MERDHFIEATARTLGLSAEAVRMSLRALPVVASVADEQSPWQPVSAKRGEREQRAEMLVAVVQAYPNSALAERVKTEYSRITEAELPQGSPGVALLFEAEQLLGENPSPEAADELLHAFLTAYIREAYQEKVGVLRRVEHLGDVRAVAEAHKEVEKLSKKLATLTR
jgi:hypothetical protein